MSLIDWMGKGLRPSLERIASLLSTDYPPALDAAGGQRGKGMRATAVRKALDETATLARLEQPGALRRLLFVHALQKRLASDGYTPDFVRQVAMAVAATLTKPPAS